VVAQELIKKEFGLSDTAMGLITGTLYGVAYALAGLPLGWACDRYNRKNLLALLVGTWSALTAACAFSPSYLHLAVARLGIGASESGGAPAALSILSNLFPPERRAMVSSIFYAGAGVGALASFLIGGYVAGLYGWRAVFLVVGLPGLVLAAIIALTVREPTKETLPNRESHPLHSFRELVRTPGLTPLYIATAFYMPAVTGVWTWMVPFFMRSYNLTLATTGFYVSLGTGLFATIGVLASGVVADWSRRRWGISGPLIALGIGSLLHVGFGLVVFLSRDLDTVVIALCAMGTMLSINAGPTNALISEIAPTQSRGLGFSVFAVVSNVIGSGLGPLIVGLLSDHMGDTATSLRFAMTSVLCIQLLAAAIFFLAISRFSSTHVVAVPSSRATS